MRILVFSDTHNSTDDCITLINKFKKFGLDMVLHAGDCNEDCEDLTYIFPDVPIYYVQGNNNFSKSVPYELEIDADGHKIFLTHGHNYRVKAEMEREYETLAEKAKSVGAEIAVFGHTHIPFCAISHGIMMLNPGSIKYGSTYGIIEIENGKIKADVINYR